MRLRSRRRRLLRTLPEGEEEDDRRLPELSDGEALRLEKLDPQQKFTQPPPRYNEASLVKTLEEKGIGRPSTYASIINTIQDRDYVKKIQSRFVPTEIGIVVTKLLVKNFPYIFDTAYTATLEGELDAVEEGHEKWTDLLNGFYGHFEKELHVAEKQMEDIKRMEESTTEVCDNCGAPLVLKWGKFGSFYSCSNFSKAKPVTVAAGPWKKDPKTALKKVTKALSYPIIVKATTEDVVEYSKETNDAKELTAAIGEAMEQGKKVTAEAFSCDFTKENFAAKPDLSAPGADEAPEEEACDNCGRTMVLRNGPWGPFMACPGYNEDPPCKTIRKLNQKVQQKPPTQLGRGVSEVRQAAVVAQWAVWRVHQLQRLSEVQVHQAGAAGCEVPEGRRRHCCAQDEARRCVLWLRELSEVRLCFESEADRQDLSEVRERLPA